MPFIGYAKYTVIKFPLIYVSYVLLWNKLSSSSLSGFEYLYSSVEHIYIKMFMLFLCLFIFFPEKPKTTCRL